MQQHDIAGEPLRFAEIVRRHRSHPRGGRVLVVVHRAELVSQTVDKLRRAGLERVGIVAAGRDVDHDAPVLVASVQTLLARETLPDFFRIDAESRDGAIMAISHRQRPIYGIQFHPESYGTVGGDQLISNFLGGIR